DWSSDVCSSDLFRRPAEKSGQVLVRTQKANTPARCGWNADRAQPFLVIAARDASSISDDRQKKRTGFGPHPESEHPGQTRLECRSRTAIACDSRERREQHFMITVQKRTGFGPHPDTALLGPMRLECRSRTAISCDSHERREQHFRRPAEKADRFWSAPNPSFR